MPLDPPEDLDPERRAIWTDTTAQLLEAGTIARIDTNGLAAYVSAVHAHRRATTLLAASDVLITRDGKAVPNPALAVQEQAARTIAAFGRQYRLTAASPQQGPDQPAQPATSAPAPKDDHVGTWCEQHHRWECRAAKSRGRGPCHAIATSTGRCNKHWGSAGRTKQLATRLVRAPTYGAPEQVTPEQALVQELWRTAGHVKWLGERVAELEAAALTWGTDRAVTKWWGEFPGSEQVQKAGPHVLLDLYYQERRHLVHVASEMVKAGLAARLISAAQEQGAAYARTVDLILHDLGLTADQWALVPTVVPARFRELMPGTGTDG